MTVLVSYPYCTVRVVQYGQLVAPGSRGLALMRHSEQYKYEYASTSTAQGVLYWTVYCTGRHRTTIYVYQGEREQEEAEDAGENKMKKRERERGAFAGARQQQ